MGYTVATDTGPDFIPAGTALDSTSATYSLLSAAGVPMAVSTVAQVAAAAASLKAGMDESLRTSIMQAAWELANQTKADSALAGTGIAALSITGAQIADATLTPVKQGISTGDPTAAVEIGSMHIFRKVFTAGVTGAADDVEIFNANCPYKVRIVDVIMCVTTAKGSATLTLRDTAGGSGTALTSDLSVNATGKVRDAGVATGSPTVAANGSVYARRSDRACAGELFIRVMRTA
jgi:hypothetical protein